MSSLPERLGVGINYRAQSCEVILRHPGEVDFVELITESYFAEPEGQRPKGLPAGVPVVCHGLQLSVGTAEGFDEAYLERLSLALERLRPAWFSDHLSMSRAGGIDIGHLAPLAFTQEMVELSCSRVSALMERTRVPFLLENITYYFEIPGAEMTEWEFIRRVVEGSGCWMLLDLNNLSVNARNHNYDPYEFLNSIPLGRVVEVHLAGGAMLDGLYVDTHGHPVGEEVWELLEFVCRRADVKGIVLERDQNFPAPEELVAELRRARRILFNA
jgi:uncharacterized protein (UPF0276 family)